MPYRAGAPGLSIWSGLPPRNARGTTPWTSGRSETGGGVGIALTGFCGPIGALNVWAEAVVASAARTEIINVFMFFLSCAVCDRLNFQIPNPKSQAKSQAPNPKSAQRDCPRAAAVELCRAGGWFGHWSLEVLWSLEVGIWKFRLVQAALPVTTLAHII